MEQTKAYIIARNRSIGLNILVGMFGLCAMAGALIAADRHYQNECRVTQEYRPCR